MSIACLACCFWDLDKPQRPPSPPYTVDGKLCGSSEGQDDGRFTPKGTDSYVRQYQDSRWQPRAQVSGASWPEVCVRGLKADFQGPAQKQSPEWSSVLEGILPIRVASSNFSVSWGWWEMWVWGFAASKASCGRPCHTWLPSCVHSHNKILELII